MNGPNYKLPAQVMLCFTLKETDMNVVKFAREIIELTDRIEALEWENAELRRYRDDYNRLLNESVAHNRDIVGGLLSVGLKMAEKS